MSAAGRIATGFSFPCVGKYNCSGDNVTFTEGMELARGVDVNFDVTVDEENTFCANNVTAETDNGTFTSGKINLTVDGLHPAAEKMVMGLPEPTSMTFGDAVGPVNVTKYGDAAKAPYVGVGFVVRYQSDGVEIFVPMIVVKTKFRPISITAKTQERRKDWQTQKLVADISRDDTSEHNWRWVAADQTTEDAAVKILKAAIGIVEVP